MSQLPKIQLFKNTIIFSSGLLSYIHHFFCYLLLGEEQGPTLATII